MKLPIFTMNYVLGCLGLATLLLPYSHARGAGGADFSGGPQQRVLTDSKEYFADFDNSIMFDECTGFSSQTALELKEEILAAQREVCRIAFSRATAQIKRVTQEYYDNRETFPSRPVQIKELTSCEVTVTSNCKVQPLDRRPR